MSRRPESGSSEHDARLVCVRHNVDVIEKAVEGLG
jgi:hypothetical protein